MQKLKKELKHSCLKVYSWFQNTLSDLTQKFQKIIKNYFPDHVITLEIIFPREQNCIIIFYTKKRLACFNF